MGIKVGEIMVRDVKTLEADACLLDAFMTMRTTGFRHLPIVDGGKIVGMVSDRDVLRAAPSRAQQLSQEEYNRIFESTPITKVMSSDLVTVTPESPVKDAVTIMFERKFGALPVVEGDNQLVGIVSVTDLLGILQNLLD